MKTTDKTQQRDIIGTRIVSGTYAVLLADVNYSIGVTTTSVAGILNLFQLSTMLTNSGKIFVFDDSGNAFNNNVTVNAFSGNTINGKSSAVINVNKGFMVLERVSATQWTATKFQNIAEWFDSQNLRNSASFIDDEIVTGWTNTAPASATVTQITQQDRFKVSQLATGVSATGNATQMYTTDIVRFSFAEEMKLEYAVNFPTLSVALQRYIGRAGFGDVVAGDFTDGAYFEYDELTSANRRICTADNGVRTKTTTSIAVTTARTNLRIVLSVSFAAPSGYIIAYYVNNVLAGSIVTNIPVSAGRETTITHHIVKSVGTTARTMLVDWVKFLVTYITQR